MRICLDFDGVIHNPRDRDPGYRMGKPVPGALEAVRKLQAEGHDVVIHTARVINREQSQHVHDWLRFFEFPPLLCIVHKPVADLYVDDKGFMFAGWDDLPFMLTMAEQLAHEHD